jgi:hypothetical protein
MNPAPRFLPLRLTSPLQAPLLWHPAGQHRRSFRALSPLWLPYPLAVPLGFLPRAATTTVPPHAWPDSSVIYVRRGVGAGAAGTHGTPRAALHREVRAGATGTLCAPGATLSQEVDTRAALSREVDAGATGTHGAPGAALCWEVGAGALGTHGAPRAALRRDVGTRAARTRGAPEASLSREVGTGAVGTHGAPEAALSREVGVGAPGTRGAPEVALSQEVGARAGVGARLASGWCLIILSSPLRPVHRHHPRSPPPLMLHLPILIGVQL